MQNQSGDEKEKTEIERGESPNSSLESNYVHETSEKERYQEVLNLARVFTSRSIQTLHESPFSAESECLDPKSPKFNAKQWAKAFYNVRYGSGSDVNPRVAGVAFKDLNVWGKGSPTDFQSSVGNSILKIPSLFGRGSQKIDILRNIDGLLLPGEQLCVLGPPG
jgi:hypothetical protein